MVEAAGGADVSALLPQEEWTPLHLACACGNTQRVQALLRQGANASMQRQVRRVHGWVGIPLSSCIGEHRACANKQTRVLMNPTPLHVASRFGATDAMLALIAAGCNVNAVDNVCEPPNTPLWGGSAVCVDFGSLVIVCVSAGSKGSRPFTTRLPTGTQLQ